MPHAPMTPAEYWDKYKPHKDEGVQPPPPGSPQAPWLHRYRRLRHRGPGSGEPGHTHGACAGALVAIDALPIVSRVAAAMPSRTVAIRAVRKAVVPGETFVLRPGDSGARGHYRGRRSLRA